MKDFKKESKEPNGFNKLNKLEKQYLSNHLKEMDEVEKRWYMNAMKTWAEEDYDNYARFHLWILGAESDN